MDNLAENNGIAELNAELSAYKYPVADLIVSPGFRTFLQTRLEDVKKRRLSVFIGEGENVYFQDLTVTPNVLIAGIMASGKTQFIYNQIAIWLYSRHPAELKLVLCGTKPIDYDVFRKIARHFLAARDNRSPIVTPLNFTEHINGLIHECNNRLMLFGVAGVKNVTAYNEKFVRGQIIDPAGHRYLPDIVVIIDDLYNFLTDETAVNAVNALSQLNQGMGIFIVAATSQINSNVISRQVKGNFTFRASLKAMSMADSRKILDMEGAEKLKSPGELLFYFNGRPAKAMQFMLEFDDIVRVIDFVGAQRGYSSVWLLRSPEDELVSSKEFDPDNSDPMFEESARLVVMHQQGTTSLIQRKLKLGYNRAGRIVDQLEAAGIVGPFMGSKAREVLFADEYSLERYLETITPDQNRPSRTQAAKPLATFGSTGREKPEVVKTQAAKPAFWQKLLGK